MSDLVLVALAGFLASLVDGALGMGFGPTSSTHPAERGHQPGGGVDHGQPGQGRHRAGGRRVALAVRQHRPTARAPARHPGRGRRAARHHRAGVRRRRRPAPVARRRAPRWSACGSCSASAGRCPSRPDTDRASTRRRAAAVQRSAASRWRPPPAGSPTGWWGRGVRSSPRSCSTAGCRRASRSAR